MFGSNTLEVAIGVVFVFLSVSLACTALNELIAAVRSSRAKHLKMGIRNLLDGAIENPKSNWSADFFAHQLINGLSKDNAIPSYVPSQTFVTALLDLVARKRANPDAAPISGAATFDQIRAIIEAIPAADAAPVRRALLTLIEEARGVILPGESEYQAFRDRIALWYEQAMDRVGGWYKRRTQASLLIIALVACFALNLDSIAIMRALAKDPALRASIVAQAERYAKANAAPTSPAPGGPAPAPDTNRAAAPGGGAGGGPTTTTTAPSTALVTTPVTVATAPPAPDLNLATAIADVQNSVGRLNGLGIPIGWVSWDEAHPTAAVDEANRAYLAAQQRASAPRATADIIAAADVAGRHLADLRRELYAPRDNNIRDFWYLPFSAEVTKVFGILMTAIATSLGAPFWFDVLNRFMSVRAAGKAPEERPKDPKKKPPAT